MSRQGRAHGSPLPMERIEQTTKVDPRRILAQQVERLLIFEQIQQPHQRRMVQTRHRSGLVDQRRARRPEARVIATGPLYGHQPIQTKRITAARHEPIDAPVALDRACPDIFRGPSGHWRRNRRLS